MEDAALMRVSDILSRIRRRRALAWFRASQILNRAIPLFSRCRDLPGALESRTIARHSKRTTRAIRRRAEILELSWLDAKAK
jgi:hypothetical protein